MSHDPNIRYTCRDHSSRPDPYWAQQPLDFFVRKHVKLGFEPNCPGPEKEHMWVQVIGVQDGHLVGLLCNTPTACTYIRMGQMVEFTADEIESVLHEGKELSHP